MPVVDSTVVEVVSYRNSTSNHNGGSRYSDWLEVVSYRNSTSNHNKKRFQPITIALYLIEILHQTTTEPPDIVAFTRCILSKFYIKPQLRLERELARCVVSYRNSTSNHNSAFATALATPVVSYRNSTSNHNSSMDVGQSTMLYLIEILHQTTTLATVTP